MVLLKDLENFRRQSTGRKLGPRRFCHERAIRTPDHLCSLGTVKRTFSTNTCFHHDVLPCLWPESNRALKKLSEPVSPSPFVFKGNLCEDICHINVHKMTVLEYQKPCLWNSAISDLLEDISLSHECSHVWLLYSSSEHHVLSGNMKCWSLVWTLNCG